MSEHNAQEEIYATLVEINQEPIELYKVLKIGNLVSGGGEAKQLISEGYVFLNGQEETQKRKKIYAGDLVSFNGEYLQVALKGEVDQYEVVESIPLEDISEPSFSNAVFQAPKAENSASLSKSDKSNLAQKKRKPISF
ncbi:RNA-binding S4 domain-containing protein [Psychromonas sp.]|nr:RNA-binding S4 domain-containing protein [Psychromonas sp.]